MKVKHKLSRRDLIIWWIFCSCVLQFFVWLNGYDIPTTRGPDLCGFVVFYLLLMPILSTALLCNYDHIGVGDAIGVDLRTCSDKEQEE